MELNSAGPWPSWSRIGSKPQPKFLEAGSPKWLRPLTELCHTFKVNCPYLKQGHFSVLFCSPLLSLLIPVCPGLVGGAPVRFGPAGPKNSSSPPGPSWVASPKRKPCGQRGWAHSSSPGRELSGRVEALVVEADLG